MNNIINNYENIKNPNVSYSIPICDWFEKIRYSEYSDHIINARNGVIDYKTTKANLPCVTYNFLFNGYKKDKNIIAGTGYMYIDIDDQDFDINILDQSKIYSYYKSFGGLGFSIIVCVENLSQCNFRSTYDYIINDLEINNYVDKKAIRASQFSILSYDPELYINDTPYIYLAISNTSITSINLPQSINYTSTPSLVNKNSSKVYTIESVQNSNKIRFNDLDKINIDDEYIVNWDGYDWVNAFIPFKYKKHKLKVLEIPVKLNTSYRSKLYTKIGAN
jgi:hypothetical protein